MAVMGRPLKFQDPEELSKMIDSYFLETPKDEWTWTGLALYLDTDKWTLKTYTFREDFAAPLKKALLKVENGYEIDLKKHGRTGTIFALKNFDWKDKSEQELTGADRTPLMPQINVLGYQEFKQPLHATTRSQDLVEELPGTALDERDSSETSSN